MDPPVNPTELRAYDHYGHLIGALATLANQMAVLPLDEMATVNQRMTDTRAIIGPTESIQANPAALEQHRWLIEAATRFRDDYRTALDRARQARVDGQG